MHLSNVHNYNSFSYIFNFIVIWISIMKLHKFNFCTFCIILRFSFFKCSIRFIEPPTQQINTVAICGGAGAEFIEQAIAQKADIFITADMKYHEMQAAVGRIGLIDMDHWTSEQFTREIFNELLQPHIQTYIAENDKTPIKWLISKE